jgi:enamine deaminase RidA (YjgF/YER057c/UK114 family)
VTNPTDPRPVSVPGQAQPSGYSDGMLVSGAAELLFVAGQIGWDASRKIVSQDFVAQFRQALENVLAVVRAAGGSAGSLVRLTIFVTDKLEYARRRGEVGEAYRAVAGKHFPAMSLVQVAALLEPGAKVEIEATAAITKNPPAAS